MKLTAKVAILIILVLAIDQLLKFYIKLNYEYGQESFLFGEGQPWARLKFVENEGMAFGITFDWKYGKLLLSLFRLVLVGGLFYLIAGFIKSKMHSGFIYSLGLITAGALGNILDSIFYGVIFTETPMHGGIAQYKPGEGYGTFLHGKVVDMFYFPMHTFQMPDWSPLFGGEEFLFFSPIFNVADAAITVGVLSILIFQKTFFKEIDPVTGPADTEIPLPEADDIVVDLPKISDESLADAPDAEFDTNTPTPSEDEDLREKS